MHRPIQLAKGKECAARLGEICADYRNVRLQDTDIEVETNAPISLCYYKKKNLNYPNIYVFQHAKFLDSTISPTLNKVK